MPLMSVCAAMKLMRKPGESMFLIANEASVGAPACCSMMRVAVSCIDDINALNSLSSLSGKMSRHGLYCTVR